MDSRRIGSENVVRKIIAEIISHSAEKGISVSEELAIYVLKIVLIHPENLFNVDVVQTKHEVDRIITTCVNRLTNRTPALDTIKMQVFFNLNYASREEFISEHCQALNSRLRPIMHEILMKKPRLREEIHEMYEKIVLTIILWSGLGTPSDLITVKEVTTALQSVFPQSELGKFLALSKTNKERQLEELRYIVTGICLYNWNCGKGGSGIENLPKVLNQLLPEFLAMLNEEMKFLEVIAFFSLAILEQTKETEFDFGERELIWEANINARQAIIFVQLIKKYAVNASKEIQTTIRNLTEKLNTLHETVQSKIAIPTGHVYPLFIQTAHIWKNLQYEKVLLSLLHNIVLNMHTYTRGSKLMMEGELAHKFKEKVTIKTDIERLKECVVDSQHFLPFGQHLNVMICDPAEIKDFDQLSFAYQGLCPCCLSNKQLLIPGNRRKFLALYKNIYYTFTSSKHLKEFSEDPEKYIDTITEIAKFQSDLIQLLQVHSKIYPSTRKSKTKNQETSMEIILPEKTDSEIQTELHPIKQNIVADYEWNEWIMRKKGLMLADLRKKSTHSSQTAESHLRRENFSQVYLPKTQESQTVKDTRSNTLVENHFLSGLRGYRYGQPANFQYLDLTEELN